MDGSIGFSMSVECTISSVIVMRPSRGSAAGVGHYQLERVVEVALREWFNSGDEAGDVTPYDARLRKLMLRMGVPARRGCTSQQGRRRFLHQAG